MDRKLIEYLPAFLHNYKEFSWITEAEEKELDKIYQSLEHALQQSFIIDCGETTLKTYEGYLSLDGTGLSIEARRSALLSAWNNFPPYTVTYLLRLLARYSEVAPPVVSFPADYTLLICTFTEHCGGLLALDRLLNCIIPCNLAFGIQNTETRMSHLYIGQVLAVNRTVKICMESAENSYALTDENGILLTDETDQVLTTG